MARRAVGILAAAVLAGTLAGMLYSCGGDDPSDRAAKLSTTTTEVTISSPDQADANSAGKVDNAVRRYEGYPDGHPIAAAGVAGIEFKLDPNADDIKTDAHHKALTMKALGQ